MRAVMIPRTTCRNRFHNELSATLPAFSVRALARRVFHNPRSGMAHHHARRLVVMDEGRFGRPHLLADNQMPSRLYPTTDRHPAWWRIFERLLSEPASLRVTKHLERSDPLAGALQH